MINIAIIDQNEIFRTSLKTLLEQIEGFSVVMNTGYYGFPGRRCSAPIQVLLIDDGLGKEKCDKVLQEIHQKNGQARSLTLVMFEDDLNAHENQPDLILKSSCKKEFEERIKRLIKF